MSALPWTTSKEDQIKLTQTLPSSWLPSLVIILLQTFVWDSWLSLSVLLKPQLWEFSHLQCQWQENKSETVVLGHMSCHRHSVTNPNFAVCILMWIWGGNMSLSYDTTLAYNHKNQWKEHILHLTTKAIGMLSHPTFVKQILAHLNYTSKILGMWPKFVLNVQLK